MYLALASIGRETTPGAFVRTPPNRCLISSFVEDGTMGYGTLADDSDPTEAPIFVEININPSSPKAGETEEIATSPVSQLSIAKTPESVIKARQAR